MGRDVECPECGFGAAVPPSYAGRKVRCPVCEARFKVRGTNREDALRAALDRWERARFWAAVALLVGFPLTGLGLAAGPEAAAPGLTLTAVAAGFFLVTLVPSFRLLRQLRRLR